MSQLIKVLQVLDLFSDQHPTLGAEQIADLLGLSRPTAFRYVAQLCETGMLTRLSGRYSLGPRIIELDWRARRFDPVLNASRDALRHLAGIAACAAVLVSMYGDQVVHVHYEGGTDSAHLHFGRGEPLPLFRGAGSKCILAHQGTAELRRIWQRHESHPDVLAIGPDWAAFAQYFRACRQRGYYVSHDELEKGITGIAAPIAGSDGKVTSSLVLAFENERRPIFQEATLGDMLAAHAREISARIAAVAAAG